MDRAIPEVNRQIAKKELQNSKRIHKMKLQAAVPAVDNSLPSALLHPIIKAKKEQMVEGKKHIK